MVWDRIAGLFRRGNLASQAQADTQAFEDLVEELRGYIARDLRGGYVDPDGIVQGALEVIDTQLHGEALLRERAQRILAEEVDAYHLEAAAWPAFTDHDRLEQAFAALESQGVVCRQNFTCCGTCGVAEIGDEMQATRDGGSHVRGYAFFHVQDTERAIDGDGLWLNYGAIEDGEPAAIQVARAIVDAIAATGLAVHWDGDWGKRIFVRLQWQRRLAL